MKPSDSLLLRRTRLLSGVAESTMARLQDEASVQVLGPGSMLFEQGERPRQVQIVLHGGVALTGSVEKSEIVVEFFGSGDVLLAAAVILDLPYLVSARTTEESRIASVPAATFRSLLHADHRLAVAMTEELARHWRTLVRQIKDLKLRSAAQRLAAYLLANGAPGRSTMKITIEKQVLAGRLGMTPASLSRAFRELKELGVHTRGNQIVLADPEALRAFCHYDAAS
ncbi:MAG: helix-turn-helix domain-containing protein [Reyranellaceae bacterium]